MVIASERGEHRSATERPPRRPSAEEVETQMRLELGPGGQLLARVAGAAVPVTVFRCFPWSEPLRFVSLRDADEKEVALVRDPDSLDAGSREALEEALIEAGFVLEIESILDIEEEIEIRCWSVQTRQGPRSFQTPRDEWPRDVPGGGLLIRDVSGDLYHVPHPDALDRTSQRHLWAFVD